MKPIELPINIPTPRAPFGGATGDGDLWRTGVNWSSGAAFVLTVRTAYGATGTALITLTGATAGTQGISATYDAGYLDPSTGAVVGGTRLRLQIDEATLEAISWGSANPDEPLELFYDLLVTPSGEPQRQLCRGPFTIYPGVGD